MRKKALIILGLLVVTLLLTIISLSFFKKKPIVTPKRQFVSSVNKVDLTGQPEWVRKIEVKTKVVGKDVVVYVTSIPKGKVKSVDMVIEYQKINKDMQGFISKSIIDGDTQIISNLGSDVCIVKGCQPINTRFNFDLIDKTVVSWSGLVNVN